MKQTTGDPMNRYSELLAEIRTLTSADAIDAVLVRAATDANIDLDRLRRLLLTDVLARLGVLEATK
jgi:hypothetical protein